MSCGQGVLFLKKAGLGRVSKPRGGENAKARPSAGRAERSGVARRAPSARTNSQKLRAAFFFPSQQNCMFQAIPISNP